MEQVCMLGLLAYNSSRDIKTGRIPVLFNLIAGTIGLFWSLADKRESLFSLCAGIAFGGAVLLAGFFTGEAIGLGDGLLLMTTGGFLGGKKNALLFLLALLAAGGYSGVLLFLKKAKKKTAVPFVPFLLLAYMGMIAI